MKRKKRLVIRLSEVEHAVIETLARSERLPPSTLARSRLLREAERRGIEAMSENDNSVVTQVSGQDDAVAKTIIDPCSTEDIRLREQADVDETQVSERHFHGSTY